MDTDIAASLMVSLRIEASHEMIIRCSFTLDENYFETNVVTPQKKMKQLNLFMDRFECGLHNLTL